VPATALRKQFVLAGAKRALELRDESGQMVMLNRQSAVAVQERMGKTRKTPLRSYDMDGCDPT
jgi:hypothetical protein